MSQQKSADQTEQPTPKKLRDARKEGQVHRSQDLTRTVLILAWLLMFWLLGGYLYEHIAQAGQMLFRDLGRTEPGVLLDDLQIAARLFVRGVLPFIGIAAFVTVAVEFLQVGPLLAFKRVKPNMEHLSPASGLKRMFSQQNLVEVIKAIVKTVALTTILLLVMLVMLDHYFDLPFGPPGQILQAHWRSVMWVAIWVIFVFFFISVLDAVYQRHAFIKNLKMSRRDIRQERKDTEGDPQMKGRRKELHQEWSQQNMLAAVRDANVVVTNPTHIAVALLYDPDETELPVVVAKGEEHLAQLIRETAEEADVPIMRDVDLARGLYENVELDDYIAPDFFMAVAEVLHWAEEMRAGGDRSGS